MLKFALIPAFLLLGLLGAQAQQSTPNAINGCIYVASAPTLSNGQRSPFLCDVNGNLKTTGGGGGGSITFPATVTGGVSGGIPYFNSTTQMSSSALLGAGQVVIGGGAGQPPSSSSGLTFSGGVLTSAGNVNAAGFYTNLISIGNNIIPSSSSALSWNNDTPLVRDAAGILDHRNGTSPQIVKYSSSYTDGSNGSWGAIDAGATTAGVLKFGSYGNGTGASTLGKLEFDVLGVDVLDYNVYAPGWWSFNNHNVFTDVLSATQLVTYDGLSITNAAFGIAWFGRAQIQSPSATTIDIQNTGGAEGTLQAGIIRTATPYTVSTLPTGAAGMRAYVTDAAACTLNTALTGGGSTACPVWYNGSAWVGS